MYKITIGILILIFALISCKSKEETHADVIDDNFEDKIKLLNANSKPVGSIGGSYYSLGEVSLGIYLGDWEEVVYQQGQKNSADLQGIENFVYLEELTIYTNKFDKIDFSLIEKLPKLRELYILGPSFYIDQPSSYITEIPDLSRMKNLQSLGLRGLSVDSLKDIDKKIPENVTFLLLANKVEHTQDIAELSKLVNLETLVLYGMDINISDLYGLTKLEGLGLYNPENRKIIIDFNGIEKLSKLQAFITRGDYTLANIDAVSYLKNLQELHLSSYRGEITYNFIRGLPQLYEIILQINDDNDVFDLGVFNNLSNICTVILWTDSPIKKTVDIADLGILEKLEHLRFSTGGFIVKNLDKVNDLPSLSSIYLPDCEYYPNNALDLIRDGIHVEVELGDR